MSERSIRKLKILKRNLLDDIRNNSSQQKINRFFNSLRINTLVEYDFIIPPEINRIQGDLNILRLSVNQLNDANINASFAKLETAVNGVVGVSNGIRDKIQNLTLDNLKNNENNVILSEFRRDVNNATADIIAIQSELNTAINTAQSQGKNTNLLYAIQQDTNRLIESISDTVEGSHLDFVKFVSEEL
jgi:fructose-bisphosphate aldolase class 1